MPRTVIFLSSTWHTHLYTTSQIRVFSMDSKHSRPIYYLHSPNYPKSILPSLISGNWVIVTLTLTPTLIYRGKPSLSGNRVVVTPKPNSNKETQQNWQIVFIPFLSLTAGFQNPTLSEVSAYGSFYTYLDDREFTPWEYGNIGWIWRNQIADMIHAYVRASASTITATTRRWGS